MDSPPDIFFPSNTRYANDWSVAQHRALDFGLKLKRARGRSEVIYTCVQVFNNLSSVIVLLLKIPDGTNRSVTFWSSRETHTCMEGTSVATQGIKNPDYWIGHSCQI